MCNLIVCGSRPTRCAIVLMVRVSLMVSPPVATVAFCRPQIRRYSQPNERRQCYASSRGRRALSIGGWQRLQPLSHIEKRGLKRSLLRAPFAFGFDHELRNWRFDFQESAHRGIKKLAGCQRVFFAAAHEKSVLASCHEDCFLKHRLWCVLGLG